MMIDCQVVGSILVTRLSEKSVKGLVVEGVAIVLSILLAFAQ